MDSVFMPDFIIYAFCVVSIVLGIFSIYVILTKSKVLGSFKYYLINQLIWSQLFEVAVVFLKPMSISPYLGRHTTTFIIRNNSGFCRNMGYFVHKCPNEYSAVAR
uniref:Serpentine Receptor, class T n=1 Tax=Panagrellus redivivus TaxID=6233 RepID=A0A7E5A1Z5_PANRE